MKILFEVTHPADVNFFRHPISLLEQAGHRVLVTSRDKDCVISLLRDYSIPNTCISEQNSGTLPSMARELIARNRKLLRIARSWRPDVITGFGGISAAQVSWYLGIPSAIFYDTETAGLQNLLTYPFATRVVVPACYSGWVPARKLRHYSGYKELSYLHPNWFHPNREIALENGLSPDGDTFLLRLISWKASHDLGLSGWADSTLETVLQDLSHRGHVLISSEAPLPKKFRKFAYRGAAGAIHHVLAYCRLYVGQSATMACEAAALGLPAIYAGHALPGYIAEQQERYGLIRFLRNPKPLAIVKEIDDIISIEPGIRPAARQRMLHECIDVAKMIHDQLVAVGRWGNETSNYYK